MPHGLGLLLQYDPEKEEAAAQAKKHARLAKMEDKWKEDQQQSKGWWFLAPFSSFPSNVIENLQV